jgi:FAD/FMN-containing dehydrogenase
VARASSTEIPFVAVEWDGDEPFLRASPDVVITPWRESDVDAIVSACADTLVHTQP